MEIKIVITKRNKEKILKLIDQLVDYEAEGIMEEPLTKIELRPLEQTSSGMLFKDITAVKDIKMAKPEVKQRMFGAWGMFNSFVPGKAALRILIGLLDQNAGNPVRFSYLIDECMTYFSRSGLYKYRGFPKKISESSRGRLAIHLILPYCDMGLARIYGNTKSGHITITKDGFTFAKLKNPLLDEKGKTRSLSRQEIEWLISYLKEIDRFGYKEFSLLKDLTNFLAVSERQFRDIVNWFKSKKDFVEWLRESSRYKENSEAFSRQLENVATTYASGKVALLRELEILSPSRATYKVLTSLKERS